MIGWCGDVLMLAEARQWRESHLVTLSSQVKRWPGSTTCTACAVPFAPLAAWEAMLRATGTPYGWGQLLREAAQKLFGGLVRRRGQRGGGRFSPRLFGAGEFRLPRRRPRAPAGVGRRRSRAGPFRRRRPSPVALHARTGAKSRSNSSGRAVNANRASPFMTTPESPVCTRGSTNSWRSSASSKQRRGQEPGGLRIVPSLRPRRQRQAVVGRPHRRSRSRTIAETRQELERKDRRLEHGCRRAEVRPRDRRPVVLVGYRRGRHDLRRVVGGLLKWWLDAAK